MTMTEDQLRLAISDMLVEMWYMRERHWSRPQMPFLPHDQHTRLFSLHDKAVDMGIKVNMSKDKNIPLAERCNLFSVIIFKQERPDKNRSATWNWHFDYVITDGVIHHKGDSDD